MKKLTSDIDPGIVWLILGILLLVIFFIVEISAIRDYLGE
jgi:hypothetical protein